MKKALIFIFLTFILLRAYDLTKIWEIHTNNSLTGLDFNGKSVAVLQGECVQFLTTNGVLINERCFDAIINSVDHYENLFVFVTSGGSVYITDSEGSILHQFQVPLKYDNAVKLFKNRVLLCGYGCALYNFRGKLIWQRSMDHLIGTPSSYDDVLYVPSVITKKLFVANLTNGNEITKIYIGDVIYSAETCKNYLVVAGAKELYLFNITNPIEPSFLWDMKGGKLVEEVSISPNCKYIAVLDTASKAINILDTDGNLLVSRVFWSQPVGVTWGKELLVALANGHVLAFELVK